MEEFVVYILYSKKYDKKYIGFTSNLIQRYYSHNYLSKKGFTIRYRPWEVVYVEFYKTKTSAMKREKYFKTGKGREWIKGNVSINRGL
jgi:putative endonuclease